MPCESVHAPLPMLIAVSSFVDIIADSPTCTGCSGYGWGKPAAVSPEPEQRGAPAGRVHALSLFVFLFLNTLTVVFLSLCCIVTLYPPPLPVSLCLYLPDCVDTLSHNSTALWAQSDAQWCSLLFDMRVFWFVLFARIYHWFFCACVWDRWAINIV